MSYDRLDVNDDPNKTTVPKTMPTTPADAQLAEWCRQIIAERSAFGNPAIAVDVARALLDRLEREASKTRGILEREYGVKR